MFYYGHIPHSTDLPTSWNIKAILFCFLPCCGWLDDREGWRRGWYHVMEMKFPELWHTCGYQISKLHFWFQIIDTPFIASYFFIINWPLKLANTKSPFVCLWQGLQASCKDTGGFCRRSHCYPLGTKYPVCIRWMKGNKDHLELNICPISHRGNIHPILQLHFCLLWNRSVSLC